MSACLPAQIFFVIMYTDPSSAYHRLNNVFEDTFGIGHLTKLLSIIVVDGLTRRRMLTFVDDGTILAYSFINLADMKVVDAT